MTAHLTVFQRDLARRLRAGGMSLRGIAKEVGCSHSGIEVVLRGGQAREARAEAWTPWDGSLQAAEREEILLGLQRNESMSAIARALGRSPSTVTKEVKSNGGPDGYRVWPAHLRARDATRRPKRAKLDQGPLCDKVTEWLKALWSPEEITTVSRELRTATTAGEVGPNATCENFTSTKPSALWAQAARPT